MHLAGREPWMAVAGWCRALVLLASVLFGGEIQAQDGPLGCPVSLHRVQPAARDSMLRSLEANEIALTGFVRDEATGAPVPNIVVTIEGTSLATQTAEDGGYLIRGANRASALSRRPMVRACDTGWDYLTEVREVILAGPGHGTVVVIGGQTMADPGHAVRIDFLVRRRPSVF